MKKSKPTIDEAAADKVPSEGHVNAFIIVSGSTKIYSSLETSGMYVLYSIRIFVKKSKILNLVF